MNIAPTHTSSKRIAKNTFVLYCRMFLTIILQLYTVPIVMCELGVNDYGLFNVIGGLTTLFSFIGGSLASGVQRFFSFAIGEQNYLKLKKIYITTFNIYIVIALVALVLFEIIGVWFVSTQMQIPDGRESAAHIVFQLTVLSFIATLITIPLNAAVIAHEDISFLAYTSIVASILKLIAVMCLQFIDYDKLITYAIFCLLITIVEQGCFHLFTRLKYAECKEYSLRFDKKLTRELLAYSGLNTIGFVANLLRQQGINILMNIFFGTLLNAAHAIATQVNGVIQQFVGNLYIASRPQITKSYASGNVAEMWTLAFRTSLLAYYLIMVVTICAIAELDTVLSLWLHEVPDNAVLITKSLLISLLIETTAQQLIYVFQAMNKIKIFQLTSSTVLLLNIPLSYLLLKFYVSNPLLPYIVQIALSTLFVIVTVTVSKRVANLDCKRFLKDVLLRQIFVTVVVSIVVCLVSLYFEPSLIRIPITISVTIISAVVLVLKIGINKSDRVIIINWVNNKIKK